MSKQLLTSILVAIAGIVAVLSLVGGPAQAGKPTGYTTLDHPSLPCNLSEQAVANWGETSAHLPLACTYDE
jgi:hypothetical protein